MAAMAMSGGNCFMGLLPDLQVYFLFFVDFFLVAGFLTEDFLADFLLETDPPPPPPPPPPELTTGTVSVFGIGVGVGVGAIIGLGE